MFSVNFIVLVTIGTCASKVLQTRTAAAPCAAPAGCWAHTPTRPRGRNARGPHLALPRHHVGEPSVVPHWLSKRCLMLFPEMRAARFFAMQCVMAEQFGEFEEIGDPSGIFQFLIKRLPGAKHRHVVPELLAQGRDSFERLFESRFVSRHPAEIPHEVSQRSVKRRGGLPAPPPQQTPDPVVHPFLHGTYIEMVRHDKGGAGV